jgi:hypothetical protein
LPASGDIIPLPIFRHTVAGHVRLEALRLGARRRIMLKTSCQNKSNHREIKLDRLPLQGPDERAAEMDSLNGNRFGVSWVIILNLRRHHRHERLCRFSRKTSSRPRWGKPSGGGIKSTTREAGGGVYPFA